MAAMVDSYPRATEMPQFYPEDPGDIVRSKPRTFQQRDYRQDQPVNQQTPAPNHENKATHNTRDVTPHSPISPTTGTGGEVKSKEIVHTVNPAEQPEIQLLPPTANEGIEDSTTAILRHYTHEKNGRPASFHLSPSSGRGDPVIMSDVFRIGGRECVVTLEEDHIRWNRRHSLAKKSGEKETQSIRSMISWVVYLNFNIIIIFSIDTFIW